MLREMFPAESVIRGCEQTLYIEHNEREVQRIIGAAINSIENTFGLPFTKPVYELVKDPTFSSASLESFLQAIAEQLKAVSFLISLTCHDRRFSFHMRDHSYLGFSEKECLAALRHLQDAELFAERHSFYEVFIRAADRLPSCEVKRWLIILGMFEKLGVPEGVSFVAQYLYLCSTWRS
jgi:hypothetical protein